jgi:hypothetical protein
MEYKYNEFVVAFDARVIARDLESEWPLDRRKQYLILPNIESPLSVDVTCWPRAVSTSDPVVATYGLTATHINSLDGDNLTEKFDTSVPGWSCYSVLEQFINSTSKYKKYSLIAISILLPKELVFSRRFTSGSVVLTDNILKLSSDWTCVGYDVADRSMLSALSNCGRVDEEIDMASKWISHINEHHLFKSKSAALDFAQESNSKILEHAPFFAYGIYMQNQ